MFFFNMSAKFTILFCFNITFFSRFYQCGRVYEKGIHIHKQPAFCQAQTEASVLGEISFNFDFDNPPPPPRKVPKLEIKLSRQPKCKMTYMEDDLIARQPK